MFSNINNVNTTIIFSHLEDRLGQFSDDHITDEISKLLKNRYSTEVITKIKDFYFNKCNIESETTRLEHICHVSTVYW